MSRYRRANATNASYFFTVVTYRRQAFLCDQTVRNALRNAINKVRVQHPFQIDTWVLLPDHIHTIWTLPENDANFSLRWQLIKRYVTRECGAYLNRPEWLNASKTKHQESTLWQRRFWEHQIRDERDYQAHMDYCHYNPVKHGLVKRVQDWPYSSFHKQVRLGQYPIDWAGEGMLESGKFGEIGDA
jgi:putative transposase